VKVKDILSDDSKWTKGVGARDAFGNRCSPSSPDAVKFCILGAIELAYPTPAKDILDGAENANHHGQSKDAPVRDAIMNAILELGWRCCDNVLGISLWNDLPSRKFEDIKKVLEKADV
jgi:hypothetical protein